MLKYVAAGLLLLAAQVKVELPESTPLDLASLAPGPVHRISVAAGQPFMNEILNRVPGATYRVATTSPNGGGSSTELTPRSAHDLGLPNLSGAKGCEGVVAAAQSLLAATDEAEVKAVLAAGGVWDEVDDGTGCKVRELLRSRALQTTRAPGVWSKGLQPGGWVDLRIERVATSAAPARTWSLRFEAAGSPSAGWTHPNEVGWLASEISADLAEMAGFAQQRDPPVPKVDIQVDGATGRVDLGGALGGQTLALDESVWSPRAWEPIARALLGGARPGKSSPLIGEGLAALTDPRALVLQGENERISTWLARDMRSAEAHEEAALLLAALALRESAGPFSDVRLILCRLTAHLAFARVLRPDSPPGRSATFADVARLVLLGRQQEAVGRLDAARPVTPSETAWVEALRMRITGDWRILNTPLTATLLERREYYRALDRRLGARHAIEFLDRRNSEAIPDWGRIVLSGSPSVEAGNRFVPLLLGLELAEAAAAHGARRSGEIPLDLVASLNEAAGRCIRRRPDGRKQPRVLAWGDWASSTRRHVLNALVAADHHRRLMLGSAEEADADWTKERASLETLELLSLAEVEISAHRLVQLARGRSRALPPGAPSFASAGCTEALRVIETHPEKVSAASWWRLTGTCGSGRLAQAKAWYGSTLPAQTAFEADVRPGLQGGYELEALEAIFRIAPWDRDLADAIRRRRSRKGENAAAVAELDARVLEYDLRAMRARAALLSDDVPGYRAAYTRIAELDPDSWLTLGVYLAARDLDDEGAAAFQKAVDDARDRVRVSNDVQWLVDYYLDRGDRDRAFVAARAAGEVGSSYGFVTLAHFFERTGQCAEAERQLQARALRYPDSPPEDLRCFLTRCADDSGDPRFGRESSARPSSQEYLGGPVTLASFSGVPQAGVRVFASGPQFEGRGLAKGVILVALDGHRVWDLSHYRCLRALGDGVEANAIIWHEGVYREIRAPLRRAHPALTFRSVSATP